jgi:hypothetical protein
MRRGRVRSGLLRTVVVAVTAAVALMAAASPGMAAEPLTLVHSESVTLGETTLTASFTDWPVLASRSLDFTFDPEGGIEGRTGTLRAVAPDGESALLGIAARLAGGSEMTLPRHPRDYGVWGLDAVALPEEGTWQFEFTVVGPEGTSTGTLAVPVGPRPGPPAALTWTIGLLPWLVPLPWLAYLWIRKRPERQGIGSTWSG